MGKHRFNSLTTLLKQNKLDRESPEPLFVQAKESLRKILSKYKNNRNVPIPTEKEISSLWGISVDTTRIAISELVKEGLLYRKQGKGTFLVNNSCSKHLARAQESKTKLLCLACPAARKPPEQNPFYSELLNGINQSAGKHSYRILLNPIQPEDFIPSTYLQIYKKSSVDGLIISGPKPQNYLRFLQKEDIPFVVIGLPEGLTTNINLVDVDHTSAMKKATAHLISHGHKRIGLINIPSKAAWAKDNIIGYQSALESADIYYDKNLTSTARSGYEMDGQIAMEKLLELKPQPTAAIVYGSYPSIGAIKKIQQQGLRIPQDFAIIGAGDYASIISHIDPPPTNILEPVYELGYKATEVLIRFIQSDRTRYTEVILPSELIVRRSCGCNK